MQGSIPLLVVTSTSLRNLSQTFPKASAHSHVSRIDAIMLGVAFSIQTHEITKSNLCALSCLSFPFPCGQD